MTFALFDTAKAFMDGPLKNLLTGRGTSVDRTSHNFWLFLPKNQQQIVAAYRASWLISRIVDLPAKDMLREWRDWQAEADEITRIDAEEKRLKLRERLMEAVILGRLGGGAILLGASDGNPAEPLPDSANLLYLHAVSRYELGLGTIETDQTSPNFNEPRFFQYKGETIHPSRVVVFKGEYVPSLGIASYDDRYWGDSIIDRVDSAVQNATTATDGFASLIDEAKVDIWKLDGLAEVMATPTGIEKVRARVEEMATFKSMHRGMYLDGNDTWEARQLSLAGMPDVIKTYMGIVAGAADIPATRLLGKSPDGMNSTGEGDMKNYWARIKGDQNAILRPALDRIDPIILRTANVSAEAFYEFAPLDTPTAKELADIEKIFADTAKVVQDTGLVPSGALGKAMQNGMIERAQWPGLEAAIAEEPDMDLGPDEEGGDLPTDVEGNDDGSE